MDQLSIPGDYRVECFPLAKSRLTLAPLIHILLLDICRLPQLYLCLPQSSAWFISHSIFKLYWYLSQLISFIWFMQAEFKEQWKKDWTLEIARLERIWKSLGRTLGPWHIVFPQISESSYQNGALPVLSLTKPSAHVIPNAFIYFLFIHLPYNKCIPYILVVLL